MDRRCLIQASSIDLVSTQIITNDQKDLRKMIDRDPFYQVCYKVDSQATSICVKTGTLLCTTIYNRL